jgi:hypothetical protein
MDISERQGERRERDRMYATAQLKIWRERNTRGVCNLDRKLPCATAWRCGFKYKTECCRNFVASKHGVENFGGVPTNCKWCSKKQAGRCEFVCVRKPAARGAAATGPVGVE